MKREEMSENQQKKHIQLSLDRMVLWQRNNTLDKIVERK